MLLKDNRRKVMDIKLFGPVLAVLLFFSSAAQALECTVEYKGKKTETIQTWYGKVEKPKFTSGVRSGTGSTKNSCAKNALRPIERAGWTITRSNITVTSQ